MSCQGQPALCPKSMCLELSQHALNHRSLEVKKHSRIDTGSSGRWPSTPHMPACLPILDGELSQPEKRQLHSVPVSVCRVGVLNSIFLDKAGEEAGTRRCSLF